MRYSMEVANPGSYIQSHLLAYVTSEIRLRLKILIKLFNNVYESNFMNLVKVWYLIVVGGI